ncbi:PIG-L family deacetylase [Anaerobacillus sp. CMMVII]|uniref:PIG-L deacetylase family protein n=1 Tax=Anaerobacillus sp. CMMVII TaxID=2755588 RepID=UPI0021B6F669|nr:PIG-L family deacetylase [Anaerobacillus sp. CMMVII]MCT8137650.1 PIG-L family deacetylase [Anaerobacillus sp. CMMVII]
MKKIAIIAFLVVVGLIVFNISSSQESSKATHIFYAPHPDDEVLTMGMAILQQMSEGHDVHIVLLTRGGASKRARREVNEKLEAEGRTPLTVEQFMDAREKEFHLALTKLNIDKENVHVFDYPDAALQATDVKEVMINFETKYPGAYHHGFTYYDPHKDHKATGEALRELKEDGLVENATFFVPRYVELEHLGQLTTTEKELEQIVEEAFDAYAVWDPENGYYAVGRIFSVPQHFELMLTDHRNRFHGIDE